MAISVFEFHTGIHYEEHGNDQFSGPCPFCEKEEKLWFNKENLWDCKNKRCVEPNTQTERSGNIISFLRQVYEEHDTITKGCQIVSDWRDLPIPKISQAGIKFNPWNNTIIIPTYRNGKLNNLYKVVKNKVFDETKKEWVEKTQILCPPDIEHTLFNFPEDTEDTIWICEGHWDKLAGDTIVGNTNPVTCIGVPGAGVWKRGWSDVLADKNVVFLYDNDQSGKVGFEKVIIKHIAEHSQKPKSISYLKWPEDTPEKFDLNDVYRKHGRKSYEFITKNIVPFIVPEGTIVVKTSSNTVQANKSIDTFEKLITVYKENFHVTPDMEACMLLALTSIYSINIEGEQIWTRVIGAPSAGKSTIAKGVAASDRVVMKSTFTSLFSGWLDDTKVDASLAPLIAGKLLVIKDADALMQQTNIAKIFSQFRDFYDKESNVHYGNTVVHDYSNIRSSIMLCGTNALRKTDQNYLGERFIDIELRLTAKDEELIHQKMLERSMALASDPGALPPETTLQAAAKGFIDHFIERPMITSLSGSTQRLVVRLANLVAKMRTQVDRDVFGRGEITFAPVADTGTRLIGQFIKIAMCAPIILGGGSDRIDNLIIKIARDIINPTSNRFLLCRDLMEGWYSRDALVESTGISKATSTRELDNLRALHLVDERKEDGSLPGRKRLTFTLIDEIKEGLILLMKE